MFLVMVVIGHVLGLSRLQPSMVERGAPRYPTYVVHGSLHRQYATAMIHRRKKGTQGQEKIASWRATG